MNFNQFERVLLPQFIRYLAISKLVSLSYGAQQNKAVWPLLSKSLIEQYPHSNKPLK